MSKQTKRGRIVVEQPASNGGESISYAEYMLSGQFSMADIESLADVIFLPGHGQPFQVTGGHLREIVGVAIRPRLLQKRLGNEMQSAGPCNRAMLVISANQALLRPITSVLVTISLLAWSALSLHLVLSLVV